MYWLRVASAGLIGLGYVTETFAYTIQPRVVEQKQARVVSEGNPIEMGSSRAGGGDVVASNQPDPGTCREANFPSRSPPT